MALRCARSASPHREERGPQTRIGFTAPRPGAQGGEKAQQNGIVQRDLKRRTVLERAATRTTAMCWTSAIAKMMATTWGRRPDARRPDAGKLESWLQKLRGQPAGAGRSTLRSWHHGVPRCYGQFRQGREETRSDHQFHMRAGSAPSRRYRTADPRPRDEVILKRGQDARGRYPDTAHARAYSPRPTRESRQPADRFEEYRVVAGWGRQSIISTSCTSCRGEIAVAEQLKKPRTGSTCPATAARNTAVLAEPAQPHDQGLPLDEVVLDGSPDPRIRGVVAVVSHDEHVSRGDGERSVVRRQAPQFLDLGVALAIQSFLPQVALTLVGIPAPRLAVPVFPDVLPWHGAIVDEQLVLPELQAIAGQTDHALDVIDAG